MSTTVVARPTGESIAPSTLDQSQYWDITWVAYVLFKSSEERTRPTRVLTSHGPLHTYATGKPLALKIGDIISLKNDEDSRWLGDYTIVGIHREDNGASIGDVPSTKIKHCVVK